MKSFFNKVNIRGRAALLTLVILAGLVVSLVSSGGVVQASSFGGPDQASCDDGSVTYTWEGIGIERPVVTSMSVDGQNIPNFEDPEADGDLGVAICSNMEDARKVGVFVFVRDGMGTDFDLTEGVLPNDDPVTADSEITITMSNLGELARYYSFSLVHGVVTDWAPQALGTDEAELSLTLKPARTPYGNGEDFWPCTATPPTDCDPDDNLQSDADLLSASLDMDFDQNGNFAAFTGAYFGLVSAMGGFVQATDGGLQATLGAPHKLATGAANVGSLQAFLPDSVLENILMLEPGDVDTDSLVVRRTEDGSTTAAPFTVESVEGGVIVRLTNITFSAPTYSILNASTAEPLASDNDSSGSGSGSGSGSLGETGDSAHNSATAAILALAILALVGAVGRRSTSTTRSNKNIKTYLK